MTQEQEILESWTPDYINDEGEQFYEKGKVAIILSEYRQIIERQNCDKPDAVESKKIDTCYGCEDPNGCVEYGGCKRQS